MKDLSFNQSKQRDRSCQGKPIYPLNSEKSMKCRTETGRQDEN